MPSRAGSETGPGTLKQSRSLKWEAAPVSRDWPSSCESSPAFPRCVCCTCLSFIKTFVEGRSDSVGTTHQSVFLTSSCIKILQLENSHSPELPECALPSGVLVPPPEPPHCPTTQHAQKGPQDPLQC